MKDAATGFFARLKQRKIVQWAIAYIAFAFALIQVLDVVADSYDWPHAFMHIVFGVLVVGFVVAMVLAWYHGEKGRQWVSGPELLLIGLALAIGGGLLWHFGRQPLRGSGVKVASRNAPTATSKNESAVHTGKATGISSSSDVSTPRASAASFVKAQPIPAKSIAVLPFENLSTDKGNAYFADGMQDLILTKLADIGDLKVISRTSTARYASHPDDLKTIGQQLGVATILEGSVQKAGNQVLINLQLIDAKTDSHIWAQSYQRTLKNIFGVEGEVAEKVATALKTKLTDAEQHEIARLPTTNQDAYTAYLKGVHQINQFFTGDGSPDHVKRAVAYLQQAVTSDPDFALAYALLARAQGDLQFNGIDNGPGLAHSELLNARKAVALDPDSAEAHDDLAVAYGANRMFDNVIPEYQAALELSPTDFRTRYHLASTYEDRGEWDKAKALMAPVIRMNPTDSLVYERVAELDIALRDYAKAQSTLTQGLALGSDNAELVSDQTRLLLLEGEPRAALRWSMGLPTSIGWRQPLQYTIYMQSRQFAEALSVAKSMPDTDTAFAIVDREMMIASSAGLAGQHELAERARAAARKALGPYLQRKSSGSATDLSQLEVAYARLAKIEMLSGDRDAAMHAIATARAVYASTPLENPFPYERAEIAAHFGDAKTATTLLNDMLSTPGYGDAVSAAGLQADPAWDPIRKDPRFQALLQKYPMYKPAVIPVAPATASSVADHG